MHTVRLNAHARGLDWDCLVQGLGLRLIDIHPNWQSTEQRPAPDQAHVVCRLHALIKHTHHAQCGRGGMTAGVLIHALHMSTPASVDHGQTMELRCGVSLATGLGRP